MLVNRDAHVSSGVTSIEYRKKKKGDHCTAPCSACESTATAWSMHARMHASWAAGVVNAACLAANKGPREGPAPAPACSAATATSVAALTTLVNSAWMDDICMVALVLWCVHGVCSTPTFDRGAKRQRTQKGQRKKRGE